MDSFSNGFQLYYGDMKEELRKLNAESITACITDPPYGLSFMGKEWDYDVPGPDYWVEVYRVLKPGAMVLAFGGTRTFHHLALALEQAGFEIRDTLMWMYGTGFPKSHDIGKAVDKIEGNEREYIGINKHPTSNNRTGDKSPYQAEKSHLTSEFKVTRGDSPWEGYGTALKPAWEPIILAMKPIRKTFADNALRHGVSGLNIDEARLKNKPRKTGTKPTNNIKTGTGHSILGSSKKRQAEYDKLDRGRWPANVILTHHEDCKYQGIKQENEHWICHDECPVKMLDEQSGTSTSAGGDWAKTQQNADVRVNYIANNRGEINAPTTGYGDLGGASRFYYTSKASRNERDEGLNKEDFPDGNTHPTIKPVSVIEWLCKLVKMPEDNIILDPFMGSGTTGLACFNENMTFIGIDNWKDAYDIAHARIAYKINNSLTKFFE